MGLIKRIIYRVRHSFFLLGMLSIFWFLFRTGTKPTRIIYPCQKASVASGSLWLTSYILPLALIKPQNTYFQLIKSKKIILIAVLFSLILSIFVFTDMFNFLGDAKVTSASQGSVSNLVFSEKKSQSPEASNIFVINGTRGNDGGVKELLSLMQNYGLPFYAVNDSSGIIGKDDIVIIKVNSQWDERGGTNTDLVKALIQVVIDHPQGFSGEVVIADNGQSQYGSTGHGGSLNYKKNNAEDPSQSMQKVADSFLGHKVSTYLWDNITAKKVEEYSEGDTQDGYIVEGSPDLKTGLIVTYPKFKTKFRTNVSFKLGVWDYGNGTYDSKRLKVINVPVLKSHVIYGVTASVKHYMGVGSDRLSREEGGRAHDSVGLGGMGAEMAQTRFPALNIIDAIWINANPRKGPATSYNSATNTRLIAASTDPIALDYWATKNILMPSAEAKGYNDLSSIDPDNVSKGSFGDWLKLSRDEIRRAGYKATLDENDMNVHIAG